MSASELLWHSFSFYKSHACKLGRRLNIMATDMRRSHQITAASISFALGIVLNANFVLQFSTILLLILIVVLLLTSVFARRLVVFVILPTFLILGISYAQLRADQVNKYSVASKIGQKVTVQGRVTSTPYWNDKGQYTFFVSDPKLDSTKASGVVRISTLSSNIREGDSIITQGKFYRALGRAQAQIIYAQVRVTSRTRPWHIRTKHAFSESLKNVFPQPVNQFIEGIAVGSRSNLPSTIQDNLRKLGLSHIIAVSGYNLTILLVFVMKLFGKKWRWLNLILSIWLIGFFVIITGASASVVRAGIMTSLFITLRYYGKRLTLLTTLFLTLFITLLIDPTYITQDLGWQLSFAALGGIVIFADVIEQLIPLKKSWLTLLIAVSISAQIMTIPLIAYHFGTISLIAPLANLIFLPFIEVLMIIGLLAGLVGMLSPQLSSLIFAPVVPIVNFLLDLARQFAQLKFADLTITKPSLNAVLLYYLVVLIAFVLTIRKTNPLRYNKEKDIYERS